MVTAHPASTRTQAVIVGAGPAGDAVAAGLRDAGFQGGITLVGAEPVQPYERPHLSKGYLLGAVVHDRLSLRPANQYGELEIDLELGDRVLDLGVAERRVLLESGKTIGWDLLCIATGSDSRRLDGLEGALYLRELAAADVLRAKIEGREPIEIVGAGFIGCEVAAVAVQRGCPVTVHERLQEPLFLILGTQLGMFLRNVHAGHGVDMRLNVRSVPRFENPPLVAVGSVPRTQLAERAGLTVDGGIVVDERGRTSAPAVFAAGDVTKFFSPLFATHIRVEHFQTAQRQGFAVGRAMAGATEPYDEAPWFWSDQYDLNLQYVGAGLPFDESIVRGEIGKPPFTVFRRQAGALVTVIGFNDHHTVARARRLMESRREVSAQVLADPGSDLRRALA